MAAIAGAAIAAGASLAGAGIGAFGSARAAKAQKAEAERNREFQQSMYQHRYQWQMEDMRRAGLNPILSYKMGAPGGASPSSVSPVNVGAPIQEGINRAVSSALQVKRLDQEVRTMQAQQEKLDAEKAALAGPIAASKMQERAMQGDRGYLYYLLNNAKGSTLTRLFGALLNMQGGNSAGAVKREDLPGNAEQDKETGFSAWMKKKRKQVFGGSKNSAKSQQRKDPRNYDWQRGGID